MTSPPRFVADMSSLVAALQTDLDAAKADRDDYERRWLAECRAHGETRRSLKARIAELEAEDDACSCEPGNAYLCLRCERIAESQDIGF